MEIYNFEQYSPEWWDIRQKKMTASRAQAVGNCGKGLKTYINEVMADYYSTNEDAGYSSRNMDRGHELEDSALMVYEFETGEKVQKVGFVVMDENVGCSPDGFAGEDGLVEIKSLTDKVYFELILSGEFESQYVWQAQMQMLVCGKNWCDLVAYNPNFEKTTYIKRVWPDQEKFKSLKKGLEIGRERIREIERIFEN